MHRITENKTYHEHKFDILEISPRPSKTIFGKKRRTSTSKIVWVCLQVTVIGCCDKQIEQGSDKNRNGSYIPCGDKNQPFTFKWIFNETRWWRRERNILQSRLRFIWGYSDRSFRLQPGKSIRTWQISRVHLVTSFYNWKQGRLGKRLRCWQSLPITSPGY